MRATSIPSLGNSSRSARARGTSGCWAHGQSPFSSMVAGLGDISVGDEGVCGVPLRDVLAQFGMAPATDQLDLVRHFGRHIGGGVEGDLEGGSRMWVGDPRGVVCLASCGGRCTKRASGVVTGSVSHRREERGRWSTSCKKCFG